MKTEGAVPRVKDAAATREAILAAARSAFSRSGYEGAGLREIAASAGATAALINRYFGSKERLFAEAIVSTFSGEAVTGGERSALGHRLARYVLGKSADETAFDPMSAIIRSAPNARAAGLMREGLEHRFARPLAAWLGGADAEQRAALVIAALAGVAVMRDLIRLSALHMQIEPLIEIEGRALQALIDGL